MNFPVLFLLASFAGRGNGNFTCVNNSHCKGGMCEEAGCVGGCEDGYYGRYCTNQCSSGCKDKLCSDQGQCTGECITGTWGLTCGLDCLSKCESCNKSNGSLCTKCKEFEYGSICDKSCRESCPKTGCDMNGHCAQTCSKTSSNDHDCVPACGVGCKTCNELTGRCELCHDGFRGKDCGVYCINCLDTCTDQGCVDGCKLGYFGAQCHSRCNVNCQNEVCGQLSGNCSDGCKEEYYGPNCGARCNEHCKDGICGRTTGECVRGCTRGYYGQHCRIPCTHCKDETCNSVSGECTGGCIKGYFGKQCTKECPSSCTSGYCTRFDGVCYTPVQSITTPSATGQIASNTYFIAGGCIGFGVVVLVCLLIFRWRKCICFRRQRITTNHKLVPERKNNVPLPPVPCEPQMCSNAYSYIEEEFVVPSCNTDSIGRASCEAEKPLVHSSVILKREQKSLLPRPGSEDKTKMYKSDLNALEVELQHVSLSGESDFRGQNTGCQDIIQLNPYKMNGCFKRDTCGKYLLPVDDETSSV